MRTFSIIIGMIGKLLRVIKEQLSYYGKRWTVERTNLRHINMETELQVIEVKMHVRNLLITTED